MVFESPYNEQDIHRAPERHAVTHERGGDDELFGLAPVRSGTWWYGDGTNPPAGWRVADGTFEVDGLAIPDMRGKYPIGAGGAYALGDAVGGGTHQHDPPAALEHTNNHTPDGAHRHNEVASQSLTHNQHGHVNDGTFYEVALSPGSGAFVPRHGSLTSLVTLNPHTVNSHRHTEDGGHDHDPHDDHELTADAPASSLPPSVAWWFIVRIR